MTAPQPTEAAELGPWLGRLPEMARRDRDPDFELDPIRFALVTALFERAGPARRALAGAPGAESAAEALAIWLEVWRDAVERVTALVLDVIDARLERAARRSGAPPRRWLALRPDDDTRAMVRARLDAAGAGLEQVAQLTRGGEDGASLVRRLCTALEEAWDELESTARLAVAEHDEVVRRLERWRPPGALWLVAGMGLGGVAAWLGLTLGGWLPAPAWLAPFARWFWSLPWP